MFDCVGVFVYVYVSVFSMGRRFVFCLPIIFAIIGPGCGCWVVAA